jgi:U3 small nucleolar RNA-associated protein 10
LNLPYLAVADDARKIAFFHIYCGLLDFFKVCQVVLLLGLHGIDSLKALIVPYTSFLLQAFDAHLNSFVDSSDESSALWTSLVTTVTKTLSYDDGGMYNGRLPFVKAEHATCRVLERR